MKWVGDTYWCSSKTIGFTVLWLCCSKLYSLHSRSFVRQNISRDLLFIVWNYVTPAVVCENLSWL